MDELNKALENEYLAEVEASAADLDDENDVKADLVTPTCLLLDLQAQIRALKEQARGVRDLILKIMCEQGLGHMIDLPDGCNIVIQRANIQTRYENAPLDQLVADLIDQGQYTIANRIMKARRSHVVPETIQVQRIV